MALLQESIFEKLSFQILALLQYSNTVIQNDTWLHFGEPQIQHQDGFLKDGLY